MRGSRPAAPSEALVAAFSGLAPRPGALYERRWAALARNRDGADAPGKTMAVPFVACMALVAQIYSLPPRVLPSIQRVEGGQPGLVHRNANGTDDLGIMQINTIWLPYLVSYTHLTPATVRDRLLERACFNIAAAGLIMRLYLDETGGELMRAVGNYHSHSPALNQNYQSKVLRSASYLFQLTPQSARPRR